MMMMMMMPGGLWIHLLLSQHTLSSYFLSFISQPTYTLLSYPLTHPLITLSHHTHSSYLPLFLPYHHTILIPNMIVVFSRYPCRRWWWQRSDLRQKLSWFREELCPSGRGGRPSCAQTCTRRRLLLCQWCCRSCWCYWCWCGYCGQYGRAASGEYTHTHTNPRINLGTDTNPYPNTTTIPPLP